MREKLIGLLIAAQDLITLSRKADFLIANDVVPVVRCKDCKHCAVASWGERYCARSRFVQLDDLNEDDFCSYGERKDNDNDTT